MEIQTIQSKIYEIRGQRVMLDFDLASLYQVETRSLNQSVKRNIERFPEEFMFQLSTDEWKSMSSQFVTTSRSKRPKSSLPYAFTEQGVAMLSAVLHSTTAVQISISIMKAFVQMRKYLASQQSFPAELAELRSRLMLVERDVHENLQAMNDLSEDVQKDIEAIYEAIGALSVKLPQARKQPRPIGFRKEEK